MPQKPHAYQEVRRWLLEKECAQYLYWTPLAWLDFGIWRQMEAVLSGSRMSQQVEFWSRCPHLATSLSLPRHHQDAINWAEAWIHKIRLYKTRNRNVIDLGTEILNLIWIIRDNCIYTKTIGTSLLSNLKCGNTINVLSHSRGLRAGLVHAI